MIYEYPNFIDIEAITKIQKAVKPFINLEQKKTYNRQGQTVSINENGNMQEIDSFLFNIFGKAQIEIIEDVFKPTYPSGDSGYEYHIYNPSEICEEHADGEIANGLLRYATAIIFLNDIDEGGELVFPDLNKTVKCEAGKLVVFPPYNLFRHYTKPAKQKREIVMTWFVYSNLNVVNI